MAIKEIFESLSTKADVAALLNTNVNNINYIIGKRRVSSYYRTFEIEKSNGDSRKIHAPEGDLKYLLTRLSVFLEQLYEEAIVF